MTGLTGWQDYAVTDGIGALMPKGRPAMFGALWARRVLLSPPEDRVGLTLALTDTALRIR